MTRRNWNREELLLALNLYCRLPFGRYHSRNPEIIELAEAIDRSPDAVAMKLVNFASFDPYHQERGVKGLQNASRADREIWDEFNMRWGDLTMESEIIYARLMGDSAEDANLIAEITGEAVFSGATEATRQVKIRLGQRFFRKVILTSYRNSCCVCEMPIAELLVASHIVPWRDDENLRVNPHNGLCLCALHDKGFDRGFFTVDEDYKIMIGRHINDYLPNSAVERGFTSFEGQSLQLPDKFIPHQDFLAIHRDTYFQG